MTAEVVDAEIRELDPLPNDRAMVPVQPGQAIVATATDPAGMVAVATRLADVLADIVERKKLYATINGRRYPTVEAWATIARLDNVVAREGRPAVKNDDGSWEAFAELIRLSDGVEIGKSSALCGDPQDRPWNSRADYQKRSMAQTRATSRAFRQQYSWIMALAGYEPTPAEEMPRDEGSRASESPYAGVDDGSLIGTATKEKKLTTDFLVRAHPDDEWFLGFRLKDGRGSGVICEVRGALAMAVAAHEEELVGKRVQVWGAFVSYEPPTVQYAYRAFRVERVTAGDLHLPADVPPSADSGAAVPVPAELPDESATSGTNTPASGSSPDAGGSTPDSVLVGDTGPTESARALRDSKGATSDAGDEEAPASKAGAAGVAPADLCGDKGSMDTVCTLLRGHDGKHRELAVDGRVLASW